MPKESKGLTPRARKPVSCLIEARPKLLEIGNACSFCLDQDDEGTTRINIKTYGNIDMSKIKKLILKKYPEAKLKVIEIPIINLPKPTKPKRKKKRQK